MRVEEHRRNNSHRQHSLYDEHRDGRRSAESRASWQADAHGEHRDGRRGAESRVYRQADPHSEQHRDGRRGAESRSQQDLGKRDRWNGDHIHKGRSPEPQDRWQPYDEQEAKRRRHSDSPRRFVPSRGSPPHLLEARALAGHPVHRPEEPAPTMQLRAFPARGRWALGS